VSTRNLIEPLIGVRWRLLCPKPQLLREQTAHLLAALHSEGIEALAAQLQQLFPLGVAQFLAVHKVVGALVVAGDAVASEHLAHHPLDVLCVVDDLGDVLPQDPPGHVLRGGWAGCCLANQCPRSSMSIRGW
jgi:hypothetical protein